MTRKRTRIVKMLLIVVLVFSFTKVISAKKEVIIEPKAYAYQNMRYIGLCRGDNIVTTYSGYLSTSGKIVRTIATPQYDLAYSRLFGWTGLPYVEYTYVDSNGNSYTPLIDYSYSIHDLSVSHGENLGKCPFN